MHRMIRIVKYRITCSRIPRVQDRDIISLICDIGFQISRTKVKMKLFSFRHCSVKLGQKHLVNFKIRNLPVKMKLTHSPNKTNRSMYPTELNSISTIQNILSNESVNNSYLIIIQHTITVHNFVLTLKKRELVTMKNIEKRNALPL